MKTTKKTRQLDLSRAQIDPSLQGVELASFNKRVLAFLLDWGIILACTKYLWITVIFILCFMVINKTLKKRISESKKLMGVVLKKADEKLQEYEIEEQVRKKVNLYAKYYIYGFLYFLVAISIIMAFEALFGVFLPKDYRVVVASLKAEGFSNPFQGLYQSFKLFSGAIAGIFYFGFFTWKWKGQTPGKRVLGIRAVKLNGRKLTLWNSIERLSGYAASASLLLIGFFQYFWDPNKQTTHDKICETIVIKDSSYNPTRVPQEKYTSSELTSVPEK